MRRLLTTLAALTLLLAACGGDDDDAAATSTTAPAGEEATSTPPMGPAELAADDQAGDGTSVLVASVTLPAAGFVVIHADADGSAGPVIGHSELLADGESTDVEVPLDEPLAADATVWPMAHIDTNENGTYDFAPPDVTDDGPATFEDGKVAMLPLQYDVEGGGEAAAGGASVSIEQFAFDPETIEVGVGDTVTWTNEDGVSHTVTAGSPGAATDDFAEAIDGGKSAEITFDEAGTYDYFCAIHPTMTGVVVVS